MAQRVKALTLLLQPKFDPWNPHFRKLDAIVCVCTLNSPTGVGSSLVWKQINVGN